METNPHQLLEGALICAWAIQATAVYIYLRGEFWDVAQQLDCCIAEAERAGLAGENVLDSGWSCPVYTHLGAGAYICGEESAMLSSLEGVLGQPRVRPPFPAQKGRWPLQRGDGRQQRRDPGECPLDYGQWRGGLPRDWHGAERGHEGILRQRTCAAAGQLRAAAGHAVPRAAGGARRLRPGGHQGHPALRRLRGRLCRGRRKCWTRRFPTRACRRWGRFWFGLDHRDGQHGGHDLGGVTGHEVFQARELRQVHALPGRAPTGWTRCSTASWRARDSRRMCS